MVFNIVNIVKSETDYRFPDKVKQGMPGGDAGTICFQFKALKEGTADIKLISSFRGEVRDVRSVRVTVTK